MTLSSRFSESPNARSKSITTADLDTHGILNRHSVNHPTFRVGVSEDKGARRTMEDAHSFVVDFDSIRGQGFFAVFDGHAGKHAAEWCGNNFHEQLLTQIRASPTIPIPDVLNQTFHAVDDQLSKMCEESDGKIHSGCTAVTAFLRIEDSNGRQSFPSAMVESPPSDSPQSSTILNDESAAASAAVSSSESIGPEGGEGKPNKKKKEKSKKKSLSGSRIRNAIKNLGSGSSSSKNQLGSSSPTSPAGSRKSSGTGVVLTVPPEGHRRVLYSANAGDARGVLCRGGKAVRLTYDHKGSDKQEAKRITDAGGFVMSGRVNGVLAVTRSLGDTSMKEFVVGAPYTTETELCEEDEFLILACDGLWDIVNDQGAVDLVRDVVDAQAASEALLKHALDQHTTDNVTVLFVRFKHPRAGGGRRMEVDEAGPITAGGTSIDAHASDLIPLPSLLSIHHNEQVQTKNNVPDMYQHPAPYPGPTPDYQQHTYAPEPFSSDLKNPYEGDRFKPKKKINDPIFLVLFILQLLGFAALSGIALSTWIKEGGLGGGLGKGGTKNGNPVTLNQSAVWLLLLVTAAAVLLSSTYLMLTRAFTRIIMHITLVLTIILNIGIAIYYWITKYYSGAIIFTIIAVLSVLAYAGMRSRIPLAALLFQVVMDVSKHHMSVYAVAFASLFLTAALSVWYTFTVIATYAKWTPGSPSCASTSCSGGKVAGLIFFETFSYVWTSQVIANVALATLAGGPYGCWYYFGPRSAGQMPKHPTLSALGRACSWSLGSISFGSLIVTILEMIRLVLNALANNASAEGNPVEACLACCAACFVGFIESLVEWFNRYAYIEIALYGKAYIPAAKDTWRLFKDRGIDALVNDSLVGMTLMWGAYAIGLLSSLFAYLYLRISAPPFNTDGQYTAPLLLFSFFIGMVCCNTLGSAIEAGVSTIFVGLGEDPQVLAIRAPELFALIAQVYPHVVQGVPH